MKLHAIVIIAMLWAASSAGAGSTDEQSKAELRRISQELLDAIAPGKAAVWERYLDERFVHMDANGIVRNKAEFLEKLTPLPPGLEGRIEIDRFDATIAGNTAILAYEIQEYLDYMASRCGFGFARWIRGC